MDRRTRKTSREIVTADKNVSFDEWTSAGALIRLLCALEIESARYVLTSSLIMAAERHRDSTKKKFNILDMIMSALEINE